MKTNTNSQNIDKLKVGEKEMEEEMSFIYLDANVIKDGGGTMDVKKRIALDSTQTTIQHLEYIPATSVTIPKPPSSRALYYLSYYMDARPGSLQKEKKKDLIPSRVNA